MRGRLFLLVSLICVPAKANLLTNCLRSILRLSPTPQAQSPLADPSTIRRPFSPPSRSPASESRALAGVAQAQAGDVVSIDYYGENPALLNIQQRGKEAQYATTSGTFRLLGTDPVARTIRIEPLNTTTNQASGPVLNLSIDRVTASTHMSSRVKTPRREVVLVSGTHYTQIKEGASLATLTPAARVLLDDAVIGLKDHLPTKHGNSVMLQLSQTGQLQEAVYLGYEPKTGTLHFNLRGEIYKLSPLDIIKLAPLELQFGEAKRVVGKDINEVAPGVFMPIGKTALYKDAQQNAYAIHPMGADIELRFVMANKRRQLVKGVYGGLDRNGHIIVESPGIKTEHIDPASIYRNELPAGIDAAVAKDFISKIKSNGAKKEAVYFVLKNGEVIKAPDDTSKLYVPLEGATKDVQLLATQDFDMSQVDLYATLHRLQSLYPERYSRNDILLSAARHAKDDPLIQKAVMTITRKETTRVLEGSIVGITEDGKIILRGADGSRVEVAPEEIKGFRFK